MKVFMLWDMEGISGLERRTQAWFWDKDATEEDGACSRQERRAAGAEHRGDHRPL